MDRTPTEITLERLYRETAGLVAAFGVLADECFFAGSGSRMLGRGADESMAGAAVSIDPAELLIARGLPILHAYAVEGRRIPGTEDIIDANDDAGSERLRDLLTFIDYPRDAYFELCLDVVGITTEDTGYLQSLLQLVDARRTLDGDEDLTVEQVAVLAGLNERTVRNAASAGELKLIDGKIVNLDARRYLEGRGFKATELVTFSDSDEVPDQLDAVEIPIFVRERIGRIFRESVPEIFLHFGLPSPTDQVDGVPENMPLEDESLAIERVAKAGGISGNTVRRALTYPLRLDPDEAAGIARALGLEPVWFSLQVLRARFPKAMDMVLNPSRYRRTERSAAGSDEVVVELSEAMIEHGYLDLPAEARALFPDDAFGTRGSGSVGHPVTLHFGAETRQTDIRVKSERTISPRARLGGWFRTQLRASPGDQIRLTRIGPRMYRLEGIPK